MRNSTVANRSCTSFLSTSPFRIDTGIPSFRCAAPPAEMLQVRPVLLARNTSAQAAPSSLISTAVAVFHHSSAVAPCPNRFALNEWRLSAQEGRNSDGSWKGKKHPNLDGVRPSARDNVWPPSWSCRPWPTGVLDVLRHRVFCVANNRLHAVAAGQCAHRRLRLRSCRAPRRASGASSTACSVTRDACQKDFTRARPSRSAQGGQRNHRRRLCAPLASLENGRLRRPTSSSSPPRRSPDGRWECESGLSVGTKGGAHSGHEAELSLPPPGHSRFLETPFASDSGDG